MKQDKRKRRSVYDYEQPFDLFEEFEKGPNSKRGTSANIQEESKQYKILFLAGFFVAIVVSDAA